MKLVCKTRGESNPQGKSRVFVAIHEDDVDAWAEKIVMDILGQMNVAVYYPDYKSDEYKEDINDYKADVSA